MAPTPIIANVAEVKLYMTTNGKKCMNTFFYKNVSVWGQTELNALRDDFVLQVIPSYRAAACNSLAFIGMDVVDRRSAAGLISIHTFPANTAGNQSAANLPGNVAFNCVRKSSFLGRTNKGSIRLAGFPEGQVTDNTMSAGEIGLILQLLVKLGLYLAANYWQPAVASSKLGTAKALVSWSTVDPFTNSQKTRIQQVSR